MSGPVRKLVGHSDLFWLGMCLIVCALFGSILLRYLMQRHEVFELGYDLAAHTQEHSRLLEENRRLLVETALQSNAERLESEAIERLGLSPMVPEQIRMGRAGSGSLPAQADGPRSGNDEATTGADDQGSQHD